VKNKKYLLYKQKYKTKQLTIKKHVESPWPG